MPSPPQPTTSTLSPGCTRARWRAGSDTSRHAAGHEARQIERDVLVDHDNGSLIDDGAFSKAADHAEGADRMAFVVAAPVGAVELRPLRDACALGTEVMQALAAPVALSAGRDEGEMT